MMDFGKESFVYYLEDTEKVSKIAKALSSQTRVEILQLLLKRSMTMGELSQKLYVSLSSISMHTAVLKEADLISITPKPGVHGSQKYCGIKAERIIFELFERDQSHASENVRIQEIPIGSFSVARIEPGCGMVDKDGYIDVEDRSYCFYDPDRMRAQLIWFTAGHLVYQISNKNLKSAMLSHVDISLELCAEAPGYNNNWPSDIYFKINDQDVAILRVKGDYGGTRGVNNPAWWRDSNTQYGELTLLSVTRQGVFLNDKKVSDHSLDSLKMTETNCFSLEIGTDPKATAPGGINLFGKGFGNYAQDILVKTFYQRK